jgi:DNA-binding Lrp family transcriptional regulator
VAQPTLAKSCNISERQLRITLGRLEARGLIKRIERDFDNKNLTQRGTIFRVLLSDAAPARRSTPAQHAAPAQDASGAQDADNKDKAFKETHNTEARAENTVRVASRFSLKECRAYADSLKSEGIQNPGGYATKIHRTGEADELIERFLSPPASSTAVDASQCPDCQGSGWWYPKGPEKGIARCKHERLHPRTGDNP